MFQIITFWYLETCYCVSSPLVQCKHLVFKKNIFSVSSFTFLGCFHLSPFSVFHYLPFLGVFVLLYCECYGFERAFLTLRRFLPYTLLPHICHSTASARDMRELLSLSDVFYLTFLPGIWHNLLLSKASLGEGSSSLKITRCPTEVRNTNQANLFAWITQCSSKCIKTLGYVYVLGAATDYYINHLSLVLNSLY